MPNYFIGELSEARLFDLVKPLVNGKKSGMLLIKGKEAGEIHIEGGKIIHSRTSYCSGEEAILAMMEWDAGRVSFDWEVTTDERTVSISTEQLLESWTKWEQEWTKIKEVITTPNTAFRMALTNNSEERNIQGEQWKVLAMCNGATGVAQIAESLGWDMFKTSKTIYQMFQSGLLERTSERAEQQPQAPAQKQYVNGNFFPTLENELRKVMGPIAPIVIEDTIAGYGVSKESLPLDEIEKFVAAVSLEITENAKRAGFTKAMTEFISAKNRSKQ
jgi:hypothetical protein